MADVRISELPEAAAPLGGGEWVPLVQEGQTRRVRADVLRVEDGASAYDVAVAAGFVGTPAQWLESLVGPQGDKGDPGEAGPKGDKGDPGTTTWGGITDKPTEYPPAAHAHAVADVGGLQEALAARTLSGPSRFYAFNDFVGTSVGTDWVFSQTGATFGIAAGLQDGGIGWVAATFVQNAQSRFFFGLPSTVQMNLGNGPAGFQSRLRINTLSSATDPYTARFGFLDNFAAESTDCAFFRYTHTVNGGRWQAVARSNNVETAIDTGVTVAAATTYVLRVDTNANGTEAVYRINGTVVATITANVPSGAGFDTGAGLYLQREALSSAPNTSVAVFDYIMVQQLLAGRG